MKFKQVTGTKYIGSYGYSLIRCSDDRFAIFKNGKLTKWGANFISVNSATAYMATHDYINASEDSMPIRYKDLLEIIDVYGDKIIKRNEDPAFDTWSIDKTWSFNGEEQSEGKYVINLYQEGKLTETFEDIEAFADRVDDIINDIDILAKIILRGTSLRPIFAKRDRRSLRDIVKNLVRCRSSNVWAYGMEVKDAKAGIGDVYVQFKGKNGGQGDVYSYLDVPVRIYQRLVAAPSKGHAVWKYLRNNFLYRKLTGSKKGVLPNAVNN